MDARPLWLLAALMAMLAAPAAAQAADPPCPPGVAPSATLRASDLERDSQQLTATHTINLELETANGAVLDDFTLALPPGAVAVRSGPSPSFRADAPGLVTVTATWSEYDVNSDSECSASVQATFTLAGAKSPKFIAPRSGSRAISELEWSLRVGGGTDLRPVQVRLRGVRHARLPGASAHIQTLTLGLRSGDPNRLLFGTGRVLRSAGWRFRIGPFFRGEFPIRMYKVERGHGRRGFGFELEFVQGDRRIGRTRGVGSCRFTSVGPLCRVRTMR
jgi:hypothetical protein